MGARGVYMENEKSESNGCLPDLELGTEHEDLALELGEFPATERGFDVDFRSMTSANAYSLVGPYVKSEITAPFRVRMPEFDDAVCPGASLSCEDSLKASFSVAMLARLFVGGQLGNWWSHEQQIGDDVIMAVGAPCLDLSDELQPLDDYFRMNGFCPSNETDFDDHSMARMIDHKFDSQTRTADHSNDDHYFRFVIEVPANVSSSVVLLAVAMLCACCTAVLAVSVMSKHRRTSYGRVQCVSDTDDVDCDPIVIH